jgi:hypothetical protein
MVKTHKQEFNERYGLDKNTSHNIESLARMSKIPLKILKEVNLRGRGAWKSNIRSVRTKGSFKKNQNLPRSKKLSAEQWGIARVYAFINKIQKRTVLNHDIDLAEKIPNIYKIIV